MPQDHLEPVLLGHLRSLGTTRVEFGTEVVSVDSRPAGVQVVLRDVRTGDSRVVHARYLVAADGAHSTVRTAVGIPMHGPDHLVEGVTALFRAPLSDTLGDCRYGIYAINQPEAAGIFLPAGRGDRWLYGVEWEPGREHLEDFTEDTITRRIRLGTGIANLQPSDNRVSGRRSNP